MTHVYREPNGPYPDFQVNFIRAGHWGMVAFPSDDGQYPGAIDASGRFTMSWAEVTKLIDRQNADLPAEARPAETADTGFRVFLSESEWIDAEDMDNFSECRQPSITPA
ncbi:MAG: hypothetical protein ACAH11_00655 [Sphingomonas sp.]